MLLAAWLYAAQAGAVFYTFPLGSQALTMRVGPSTGVAEVSFTVSGSSLSPSPLEVSAASPIEVEVIWQRPFLGGLFSSATVTVDASAGLACQAGSGCGSTVIPFSDICWTTSDPAGSGEDLVSSCFTGSASQQVASFGAVLGTSRGMRNNLTFRYRNTRVYPAGTYRGRVTFTATLL
ncbi:hypothetical protein CCO03_11780 [Comamonas serinivorans]|uniref:Uncharacterized protein n=1 Tax=Comamonas serinivorans TaxID=1082851 RepID=A0A1Y0EP76_9BURK|nr:hypothetical protein CCO03_11780 [Comamonas serinivorans]